MYILHNINTDMAEREREREIHRKLHVTCNLKNIYDNDRNI